MYATDAQRYKAERDFYFNLRDLPFPLAESNDELEENILNFDENVYLERLERLFAQVGLCDNGNACGQVVDWIVSHTR